MDEKWVDDDSSDGESCSDESEYTSSEDEEDFALDDKSEFFDEPEYESEAEAEADQTLVQTFSSPVFLGYITASDGAPQGV